jgi:short-subunit dehydrogenase
VAAGAGVTGATSTLSLEHRELLIGVNLTGVFLSVKHTIPHLIDAGGGALVTIGSVASLMAAGRTASYDAAKGGVLRSRAAVAVTSRPTSTLAEPSRIRRRRSPR